MCHKEKRLKAITCFNATRTTGHSGSRIQEGDFPSQQHHFKLQCESSDFLVVLLNSHEIQIHEVIPKCTSSLEMFLCIIYDRENFLMLIEKRVKRGTNSTPFSKSYSPTQSRVNIIES